jgi:vacuolar-type H+-ATPase subunit I/STV1
MVQPLNPAACMHNSLFQGIMHVLYSLIQGIINAIVQA